MKKLHALIYEPLSLDNKIAKELLTKIHDCGCKQKSIKIIQLSSKPTLKKIQLIIDHVRKHKYKKEVPDLRKHKYKKWVEE